MNVRRVRHIKLRFLPPDSSDANPRHARRFCEARGARAKTDRADAAMLARMDAALALEPRTEQPQSLRDLNDLLAARRALVKDRTAAKNRAKGLSLPLLRRQNAARLKRIEADLAAIQHNADAKRVFKRLSENGKPARVAITAVMRKLIVLANALIRDHR
jgi:transposase